MLPVALHCIQCRPYPEIFGRTSSSLMRVPPDPNRETTRRSNVASSSILATECELLVSLGCRRKPRTNKRLLSLSKMLRVPVSNFPLSCKSISSHLCCQAHASNQKIQLKQSRLEMRNLHSHSSPVSHSRVPVDSPRSVRLWIEVQDLISLDFL